MYNIHTRKCTTFIPANAQRRLSFYLNSNTNSNTFSSEGKMRISDLLLRRAFLCCLLLPILGFVSIIMFGHQHSQSASSSDDHSEAHRRTKRQDPGIGDDSPHTYEVKSSRYVSTTSLFGGSGSYIVDMYCSFCGINN